VRQPTLPTLALGLALVTVATGCTIWPKSGPALSLPESAGIPRSAKPASPAKLEPVADAISLSTKAKPSAGLYVAMARLAEQSGKLAEAEDNYQRALNLDPQNVDVLVGYARLKDRQGQLAEATGLYGRAVKAEPKNASVYNDLGLCLARQKKFGESRAALEQAIQLEPRKWLYRNNIAMVLVEMGQVDAAMAHLAAVQDEAVAHYNIGYILQKKGDSKAAAQHFAKALAKNPRLVEAQVWLDKLGQGPPSVAQSRPPAAMQSPAAPRMGNRTLGGPAPQSPAPAPLPRPELQAPGRPISAPGYANVAPLPPATSLDQAPVPGESNGARSPVTHPLPPVTP
jgi:Tfp pilus assembly protein PilF